MKETYKLPVMCLVTTLRIVLPNVYVGNFDKQIQLKFCIHLFITTIHTCDMLKTKKLNRSLKNRSLVTNCPGPSKNGTKYRLNSYDKALYF